MKHVKLTEDEFDERFTTVKNHFFKNPEDCPFDGCMFETYGQEHDYVLYIANNPATQHRLWTIVEADDDNKLYFLSGYHYVNRLGYLITEESIEADEVLEVEIIFNME